NGPRCVREDKRRAIVCVDACLRVLDVGVIAARFQVLVYVEHLPRALYDAGRHAASLEVLHQLVGVLVRGPGSNVRLEVHLVLFARRQRRELPIERPFGVAHCLDERLPLFIAEASDDDPAFVHRAAAVAEGLAFEGVMRGRVRQVIALRPLHAHVRGVVEDRRRQWGAGGLKLGALYPLSLAGAVPVVKRRHDRDESMARVYHVIRVVSAETHRRASGEAREVVVAGYRREDGAESQEVAVRSVEPLHRLVGGDYLRVDLDQVLVREPPALDDTWRDVRQENVRPLDEPPGDPLALLAVAVEEDAELARVVVVEVAAHVVAGLALRERRDCAQGVDVRLRFDSHDGRAIVCEQAPADRPGAEPGEIGYLDAFQGQPLVHTRSRNFNRSALNSAAFSIFRKWLAFIVVTSMPGYRSAICPSVIGSESARTKSDGTGSSPPGQFLGSR